MGGRELWGRLVVATDHQFFPLLEAPEERCECSNVHCVTEYTHEVVKDSSYLSKQCPNPFRPFRDFYVK
jgi:hypothetical protein